MSTIINKHANKNTRPLMLVQSKDFGSISPANIERYNIYPDFDKIVGLDLLNTLSTSLSGTFNNISNEFTISSNNITKYKEKNDENIEGLSSDISNLSSNISSINEAFETMFPDRVVRFRGFSSTDPSTGVITINGIKYYLSSDFTSANNGDVFYYKEVQEVLVNGVRAKEGIIYAYVYVNGQLKEDILIENRNNIPSTGHFSKLGYGFYNNLSTAIFDGMVADDANIKMSKISGLTEDLTGLSTTLENLNRRYSFVEKDLSTYLNYLSNIMSETEGDLSEFISRSEVKTITDSLSTIINNDDNFLSNEIIKRVRIDQIRQGGDIAELSEEDKKRTDIVPSIHTLNESLKKYAVINHNHDDLYGNKFSLLGHNHDERYDERYSQLGHKHNIADINNLTNELDVRIPFSSIDTYLTISPEDDRVPSSKLLKSKVDDLENKLNTFYKNIMDNMLTLDKVYPIGSIYVSVKDVSPEKFIPGTKWQRISPGRVLQTVKPGQSSNQLIEAGLPNIAGDIAADNTQVGSTDEGGGGAPKGVFYRKEQRSFDMSSGRGSNGGRLGFKASKGTLNTDGSYMSEAKSPYGKSTTVQPPAFTVYMWIRTDGSDNVPSDTSTGVDIPSTEQDKSIKVIESWNTGNDWYRIWSDGWCEQGGYIFSPANSNGSYTKTVLLHRPYKNTKYTINTTASSHWRNGSGNCGYSAYILSAEKDRFYPILCNTAGSENGHYDGFYWEAKGYIDLN